ncbi:MAG: PstS family phosphate ABC transporter substrate-binding protein [Mucilaginibacter sp.]|uniref:PstS family phosphate ABC transporter substrate-binding protein n=1 Tax=Mucilaginibacter sp. TaxID=1882438 RepID=UPI0034E4BFA1
MKSRKLVSFSCAILLSIIIVSCNNVNTADQFTSGSYRFVFDESLSPLLDQELYVFKSIYPDAKPDVIYQPENKILDLMLNNKAKFAIMGRTLNPDEVKVLSNRNLPPQIGKIAEDAIALIVGKNSPDSLMLLSEVKSLFLSNTKTNKNLVFDSPNSSIINYLMKLSGTNQLKQKNVYALKNSKEVIKYVATHQDAIGFISYSWLLEPDADYASAAQNISVVGVKDDKAKNINNGYVKPSQSALALNQYSLKRTIYVVDCTGKVGLGTGFASFLQSERGQKIVLRSGLLPDSLPRRDINIKKDL